MNIFYSLVRSLDFIIPSTTAEAVVASSSVITGLYFTAIGSAIGVGYLGWKGYRYLHPKGVYQGNLVDGKAHGEGKFSFPDGTCYEGNFVQGKFHGRGKVTFANGNIYEGDFAEGKCHHKGKIIFADGGCYEDIFIEEKSHGKKGEITDKVYFYGSEFFNEVIINTDISYSTLKSISENVNGLQMKVVAIQARWRGHLARRPFLPIKLRNQAHYLIQDSQFKKKSQMAEGGLTAVYLPQEIEEIVIKEITKSDPQNRFHKCLLCSHLLNDLNIKHLILPRFWQKKRYHIEERLSINILEEYNLSLYYKNTHLFDDAVKDFVKLYSRCYITDIVSESKKIIFSNLPFFIQKNKKTGSLEGKVGLIDIEYLENRSRGVNGFIEIAVIFPEHVSIIKEETDKLGINIDINTLEIYANRTRNVFENSCVKYTEYIKNKCSIKIDFLIIDEFEKVELMDIASQFLEEKKLHTSNVRYLTETLIETIKNTTTKEYNANISENESFVIRKIKIDKHPIIRKIDQEIPTLSYKDATELLEIFLHFFQKKKYIFSFSIDHVSLNIKY